MLVALGCLSSAQTKGTEATAQAVTHLLNYCATHPDAILRYHTSDMYLHIHSDASYLSEAQAKSRVAGYYFLRDKPKDPTVAPSPDSEPPPENGALHVLSNIMKVVVSSATEAEMGGVFFNAKEGTTIRVTLDEMGHPQGPTPFQTDNACAAGIVNNAVKQRRSKAMDMRFYWVRDRVNQVQRQFPFTLVRDCKDTLLITLVRAYACVTALSLEIIMHSDGVRDILTDGTNVRGVPH